MLSQLSGLRPSTLDSRSAISGDTALLPFTTRLSVEAATPRCVTSVLQLIQCGSMWMDSINSPGWGGLCIFISDNPRNLRCKHYRP